MKNNGRTLKQYYCDCGTKITYYTVKYGTGQCRSCANTRIAKEMYPLKYITSEGYVYIRVRNHPYTTKAGYLLEHRLVMEKHLGRYLKKYELVHHLNGIRTDNRIKNLAVTDIYKHERKTLIKILQERIKVLEGLLNVKK